MKVRPQNKILFEEMNRKEIIRQKKEDAEALEQGVVIEERSVYRSNKKKFSFGLAFSLLLYLLAGILIGYDIAEQNAGSDCIKHAMEQGLISKQAVNINFGDVYKYCGYTMDLTEEEITNLEIGG